MFNRALFEQKGIIAERLLADERRFTYLEQMVMFLFYFTLSEICYDQGRVPQARLYYQKAEVHAHQLEEKKDVAVKNKDFWLYDNGLMASWCSNGFRELKKLLLRAQAQTESTTS